MLTRRLKHNWDLHSPWNIDENRWPDGLVVDAREVTGGDDGVDAGEAAGGEHRADADVVAGRDLGLATRMDLGIGGLDLGDGDAALVAVVACRIALPLPCRKRRPLGRRRVVRFSPGRHVAGTMRRRRRRRKGRGRWRRRR